MTAPDFKQAYKTIMDDHFTPRLEISFVDGDSRQTLVYEKASWCIDGVNKGLRYGENPGQEAALYRLVNGNLALGEVQTMQPGRYLVSDVELLQSGKHPGKTNITDVDSALNIMRYLMDKPCAVIVKHNNPCGVALGDCAAEAYRRANAADMLAAFGGAIVLNRPVDQDTAELIAQNYAEVVAAPAFAEKALAVFARKKNLRVMRIANIGRLAEYACQRVVDFKALVDGGLVAQWSFVPQTRQPEHLVPAQATYKGREYKINRSPTPREYEDLIFGWLVECGVTSNSVIYVKDGATVGIGTGEQERVGVAEIARDKAYRKLADRLCREQHGLPYNNLQDPAIKAELDAEAARQRGGLPGACMISDAFFPFRDGVDVGLREGVTSVIQPGGSERDFETIEACNEADAAMVFTGQRCFRH
ncbi:MAG: IMP cyclohydrolase [Kiritimatiellia bacterium]|nr:IMP cyclohydrolase [Lentisphaerota bacterium]